MSKEGKRGCELNANSSVRAKVMDFKFGVRSVADVLTWPLKKFSKKGRGQGHVTS